MENENKAPVFNRNFEQLTDESPMPYGQHAGKKMKDVPAKDLLWLADNDKCSKSVRAYITDNWDVLCKQAGRNPKAMNVVRFVPPVKRQR